MTYHKKRAVSEERQLVGNQVGTIKRGKKGGKEMKPLHQHGGSVDNVRSTQNTKRPLLKTRKSPEITKNLAGAKGNTDDRRDEKKGGDARKGGVALHSYNAVGGYHWVLIKGKRAFTQPQ